MTKDVSSSFRNVSYPRLGLYVLGADWYNFVADPDFAFGDRDGLKGRAWNLGDVAKCQLCSVHVVFLVDQLRSPCKFILFPFFFGGGNEPGFEKADSFELTFGLVLDVS